MRRATNAITDYYDQALQSLDITTSQFSLLINLNRLEKATTTQLADYVNLERSTVVRNLKLLQSKGYVIDLSKAGERNHCLVVSESGKDILHKGEPIWEQVQDNIKDFLGRENVDFFMEMLYKLQELSAD